MHDIGASSCSRTPRAGPPNPWTSKTWCTSRPGQRRTSEPWPDTADGVNGTPRENQLVSSTAAGATPGEQLRGAARNHQLAQSCIAAVTTSTFRMLSKAARQLLLTIVSIHVSNEAFATV